MVLQNACTSWFGSTVSVVPRNITIFGGSGGKGKCIYLVVAFQEVVGGSPTMTRPREGDQGEEPPGDEDLQQLLLVAVVAGERPVGVEQGEIARCFLSLSLPPSPFLLNHFPLSLFFLAEPSIFLSLPPSPFSPLSPLSPLRPLLPLTRPHTSHRLSPTFPLPSHQPTCCCHKSCCWRSIGF